MTRHMLGRFSVAAILLLAAVPALAQSAFTNPDGSRSTAVVIGTKTGAGTADAVSSTNPVPMAMAPSSASTQGIAPVVTSALAGSLVLKASAGNFYAAYITTGATAGYLLVFNATSAPGDGAVTPSDCVQAPANTTTGITRAGQPPAYHSTGITLVFSTTGCFTKTISATAFLRGDAQ